ncbi:MAG TPA: 3-phosphoserine/phosphohydroxythreonine transaminase [Steroidobacteraceae bacterium]|jgi:phosphoserine aminotransferase|nr:3-phosphoserine/phosphohydroxythreonine transaminase [Steroidobacteraceae bacterium]
MRAFNFSPGPAALPVEVMEQAQSELLDWQRSGMSVMEISHRSKEFVQVAAEAEADLRDLLSIPRNYKVLFLQGGASAQFSLVPLNLAAPHSAVDYIDTGHWSRKAIAEAKRYCTVHVAGDAGGDYMRVPAQSELRFSASAVYAHYTPNETISGVEFGYIPETRRVPLIADMSSSILSQPVDVSKFGLIYAGAQKNIGPPGLAVVIVREDLIGHARMETPAVFDYKAVADNQSMLNTPPTFAWYMAGLVFKWLKSAGGLTAAGERNRIKSQTLYAAIDGSRLYENRVAKDARSRMNVTFTLNKPELDAAFLSGAAAAGLQGLKGHRVLGGMRASIYNAMPLAGVEALIAFMREFELQHVR